MNNIRAFFAYPTDPPILGETIRAALSRLHDMFREKGINGWEQNDVAGRFIIDPIFTEIRDRDMLVADITRLNFNVVYEIGYAIGLKKRVILVRNSSLQSDEDSFRQVGIFDTLGYERYDSCEDLTRIILDTNSVAPLRTDCAKVSKKSPVYLVMPQIKSDAEIRILSRIKKARLQFRSFDPEEHGRLSAGDAIDNVAISCGVVAPLLSAQRAGFVAHNMRAAFIAGLCAGMDKQILLLQAGDEPVPIDYRDVVAHYKHLEQIDEHISGFAADVTDLLQSDVVKLVPEPTTFLARLNLGSSSAENELRELGHYFLETDEYRRTLRGDVQVVAGRKGAGKTALFVQVRDQLKRAKNRVVLDLRPEGFQLIKLKELILDLLGEGTKEHTITAFWEYLLLLEICHKLLQSDKILHTRDHNLFDLYQRLASNYHRDAFVAEGDFAERLLLLIHQIAEKIATATSTEKKARLSNAQITETLYLHDVAHLRQNVMEYLAVKREAWVLIDNLDKGWPAHGLKDDDVLTIRCLLEAIAKLARSLRKHDVQCYGTVFIRNDVYELLVASTPDRGKTSRVALDWTHPELLRELLRRRFVYNGLPQEATFDEIWRQVCVSLYQGEESSQYLIERCLMRPRALLELVQYCRSHAVNLGHSKILDEDIRHGEEAYSQDLVTTVGFEIQDLLPEAGDVLYSFIESDGWIARSELESSLREGSIPTHLLNQVIELLLWYGVLGFVRDNNDEAYIYSVKYDMKRLKALMKKNLDKLVYCINPAFWAGLEIKK